MKKIFYKFSFLDPIKRDLLIKKTEFLTTNQVKIEESDEKVVD